MAYTTSRLRGWSLGQGQQRLTTEWEEGSSEGEAFLAGLSRALPLSPSPSCPRASDRRWQKSPWEKVLQQDKASAAWGWVTLLEPEQQFSKFWFQTFPLGTKTSQWIIKAHKCFLPKRKYLQSTQTTDFSSASSKCPRAPTASQIIVGRD